jgi:hypothetical protein
MKTPRWTTRPGLLAAFPSNGATPRYLQRRTGSDRVVRDVLNQLRTWQGKNLSSCHCRQPQICLILIILTKIVENQPIFLLSSREICPESR